MGYAGRHEREASPQPTVSCACGPTGGAARSRRPALHGPVAQTCAWFGALLALAFSVLAGVPPPPVEPGPLVLTAHAQAAHLSPHLSYLHDHDGVEDFAGASRQQVDGRFAPLPGGSVAFGFQPGAYWFHARILNRDNPERRWLLVQQFALSDRVDVYLRYPDGRIEHRIGGDSLPFRMRDVRYRHPNFWVDLPPGQTVDLLIRVQSQGSMQVPLSLYTPTAFAERARDASFGIGVYYGILLALFFYNLVLWLMLRDASYLWYVLHLAAFGLALLTLYGLGFEYLWPRSTWLADKAVPLSLCLAQIGMQQFARVFLDLRSHWPLGDRVALVMIGLFVALGIASLWLPASLSAQLAMGAVFVSIAWIAVEAGVAVRSRYKPAWLFLLAWSMFLLGTGAFAANTFGLLPKMFATEYGVQVGSALEMLLLSVALGYRYASLRKQNERIVRDAKAQLERKVEQRTTELRTALGQLEHAHARLRESSERDSLTGLHNRSYFREGLQELVRRSRATGRPLSLLMIDLDHFKAINDTYGHLIGDECLRHAAHTIGQVLRRYSALLARFGGEEFVVALPGMDLATVAAVAEEVRRSLQDTPCRTGSQVIPITASLGAHTIDGEHRDSLDAALQCADAALYEAKAAGRNRVRTSRELDSCAGLAGAPPPDPADPAT